MGKKIVMVSGKDPREGQGGASSYLRLHARAAICGGFEPHIFCLGPEETTAETDFGVVHPVRARWRPFGPFKLPPGMRNESFILNWFNAAIFSPRSVPLHAWGLVDGIVQFARTEPGLKILHGFYTWGYVAVKAKERLARQGRAWKAISSVYTTIGHEMRAMADGISPRDECLKRVFYEIEWQWVRQVVSRYEGVGYHGSDLVLANYESVRRLYLSEHGPHRDFRLIPYAAEPAFREGESRVDPARVDEAREPLIVSVSRHDPRKGVDVLLRALAEMKSAGIAFRAILVGFGPLLARHRGLATELRLDEVVRIAGMVDDPFPYLRQADIYVLPSLQEGSGSVSLLEAMQAGAAVVASDVDGIPEDVTDEVNGLLVEPGNVKALAFALTRLIQDDELRRRLAAAARRTYEDRFTAERLTTALSKIYEEVGG